MWDEGSRNENKVSLSQCSVLIVTATNNFSNVKIRKYDTF